MGICISKTTKKGLPKQSLFLQLLHLSERASHSTHKVPLALHIGFQIFCTLPICLPDCFRVVEMFHDCTGGTVPALHPGRYALSHRVQEPGELPRKKDSLILLFFNLTVSTIFFISAIGAILAFRYLYFSTVRTPCRKKHKYSTDS